jgi:hypothetical protein
MLMLKEGKGSVFYCYECSNIAALTGCTFLGLRIIIVMPCSMGKKLRLA